MKEERGCKVVLILNDGELDSDKADFDRYFEKVVDVSLEFAPTSKQSTLIAIPGSDSCAEQARQNAVTLGITNIRVLRQIRRVIDLVEPTLSTYDSAIFRQAIHTLVLLGWPSTIKEQLGSSL
ncbi:MAG: hypothetical protein WDM81_01420 [Rhizomicrobium sp.]